MPDLDPQIIAGSYSFKGSTSVSWGTVLAFDASGISWSVSNSTASTSMPVGISMFATGGTGKPCAAALPGSVVKCVAAGTINAGDSVVVSSTTGAVKTYTPMMTEAAYQVGTALESIVSGQSGYILVNCLWTPKGRI